MVSMLTECPHCKRHYHVKTELAGQSVRCGECGQSFTAHEYVTPLERYQAPAKEAPEPDDDHILSAPVQTPSWRETPVLRTSAKASATPSAAVASGEDDWGRTPVAVGEEAPPYWGLRIATKFHTYSGVLAVIIGVVVIAVTADNAAAGVDTANGAHYAWGLGLTLYGVLSLTLSRALIALRDTAINSYLAAR